MAHSRILVIQGSSSIRATGDAETAAALNKRGAWLTSRTTKPLDTRAHEQSIASGYWAPVEAQVRNFAAEVLADLTNVTRGAVIRASTRFQPGCAWRLSATSIASCAADYDRDQEVFRGGLARKSRWRSNLLAFRQKSLDLPGDVVLRIELSYAIQSRCGCR